MAFYYFMEKFIFHKELDSLLLRNNTNSKHMAIKE